MVVSDVKIIGRGVLTEFIRRHADVRGQVAAWVGEVEEADWKSPQDVRARYPSVSFVEDKRAIFNLKGNKYRLDTRIAFEAAVVAIVRMGTHPEYSQWKF